MEQVYNSMLHMTQATAERPAAKPAAQPQEKESFQKQMEQASGKTETKTETAVQDQAPEGQVVTEDPRELEKQMALAAMAVMQNPVVPVEQVMVPEETAVTDVADVTEVEIAVETADAPAVSAPVTAGAAEVVPEEGMEETVRQLPSQEQAKPVETEALSAEDAGAEPEIKVTAGETGETGKEADPRDASDTPEEGMAETPLFQEVRDIPVKVGEPAAPEETYQVPVEDQIAPKVTETLNAGDTRVEIQLAPESLGKVTVEVTLREDGTLHVALHAENSQTRGLLERSVDNLVAMLGRDARQEVQVEVPRQQESQQQNFYDGQQGREHQERGQQQERRQERQGGEDFLHQLRLGLVPGDGE